jgi:hypothetical protein
LLADGTMEAMFKAFLGRKQFHESLECGAFAFDPGQDLVVGAGANDPGVFKRAHLFLASYRTTHRYAVVVLDNAWDHSPGVNDIMAGIATRLAQNGWDQQRCAVIVIDPELEAWIWQDSPHVEAAFKYRGPPKLRVFLQENNHWPAGQSKPSDPKAAVDHVVKRCQSGPPLVTFRKIMQNVSVSRCVDPALNKPLRGGEPVPSGGAS